MKVTKIRGKLGYKILLVSFDSVQESGTLVGKCLIQNLSFYGKERVRIPCKRLLLVT